MIRGILSLLGLIIAGGVFLIYTQPTYDNIHALQQKIDQYNQALDKATELQKLKQSLLTRYNAFNTGDLDRLHKLLPDHVDNVRLILDLDHLAGSFGMALQNVVISSPASESNDKSVIGAISSGKERYDSITLKFSTQGTYANLVKFMEALESSLRIVDIVSVKVSQESQKTGADLSSGPSYRYDITIRTYWLK